MSIQTDQTEMRALTDAEIDDVAGGLTIKLFGYQLDVLTDDKNKLHVWVGTYKSDGSGHSRRII